MQRWVGLLRGINVGGKRKVPMAELREAAESVGLSNVSTYIQSGNLIFESGRSATEISADLRSVIRARFEIDVPVVLRTSDAFGAIGRSHPFESDETDQRFLMVGFLDREPTQQTVAILDAANLAPDRHVVSGSEIFIDYPEGSARSKLTADLIDRKLEVICTMRNWRTVQKLAELCGD